MSRSSDLLDTLNSIKSRYDKLKLPGISLSPIISSLSVSHDCRIGDLKSYLILCGRLLRIKCPCHINYGRIDCRVATLQYTKAFNGETIISYFYW